MSKIIAEILIDLPIIWVWSLMGVFCVAFCFTVYKFLKIAFKAKKEKQNQSSEKNEIKQSALEAENFVPIGPDWQQNYYRRLLRKRMEAFLLDFILTTAPCLLLGYLLISPVNFLVANLTFWMKMDENFFSMWIIVLWFLLFSLPISIMESSKWKGTFGKRIMKIEITDNYGNHTSFLRSLFRNFMKGFFFTSYLLIIPAIVQYFTFKKTRKFFHDYFSNTIIGERL
jgi:uncharacterized RDD family membrane protein YckC